MPSITDVERRGNSIHIVIETFTADAQTVNLYTPTAKNMYFPYIPKIWGMIVTGNSAGAIDFNLQGSIDGVNYETIIQVTAEDTEVWTIIDYTSAVGLIHSKPFRYFRVVCTTVGGTDEDVFIIGMW